MEPLRRFIGLKPHLRPEEQGDRLVFANAPEENRDFCDNLVITWVSQKRREREDSKHDKDRHHRY